MARYTTMMMQLLIIAMLFALAFAKTKHQKMFEDLYIKSEEQLLADDFIGIYAPLLHRNIIGSFLVPGPHQESNWGSKAPFILNNPQLVNLAIGLEKNQIARLIIQEVERRRPRGFDNYPDYAGQSYPLPLEDQEGFPTDQSHFLPLRWIEHQFLKVTVINPDTKMPASDFQGTPVMCLCVLNRNNDCFDLLVENGYKPTITSNKTYILEPVILASNFNVHEVIPKLVELGAPFDMTERGHILTSSSPYLSACTRGHVEFVEQMLRMGYDIDEQNQKKGDTCLHAAAMKGHFALAAFLIKKGADLTIINEDDGQSAYSLSVQHHHRHVQALIADALLQQRLPLPKPPTLRQRLNDMERQDEIHEYMLGYMERTGKTHDDVMKDMDIVPYDPYYDFNGTYDPTEHLGNVDPTSGNSDQIQKSGASNFLVELDGVLYTAGTHSYRAKMDQYLEDRRQKLISDAEKQKIEHDELMKMVDNSLQLKTEKEQKELEELQSMPNHPAFQQKQQQAIEMSNDVTNATPMNTDAMFSTKLYKTVNDGTTTTNNRTTTKKQQSGHDEL